MKKLRTLILCGLLAFVLASCGGQGEEIQDYDYNYDYENGYTPEPEPDTTPAVLQYVMDRAHERRLGIIKPDYNVLMAMTHGRVPAPLPGGLWEQTQHGSLSLERALEDVEIFFQALYNAYAGFVYFGGNEVFLPIKDAVIYELTEQGDMIGANTLAQVLHSHLYPVINDRHFMLGNQFLGHDMLYFLPTQNLKYKKTENGFINAETRLYLLEIYTQNIYEVMRLHGDVDGQLFYRPVLLSSRLPAPLVFTYEDGSIAEISFRALTGLSMHTSLPSLTFHDGIPVVAVRTMGFDGHSGALNYRHAVRFLSFIDELRDEPVIIVDVRSNGGGNGLLPLRWLYALTGEIVPSNYVGLQTRAFSPAAFDFNPENIFQNPLGVAEQFSSLESFGENYTLTNNHPDRLIEHDQKIIVLTDRFTGSAAEAFVDLTTNMANTLIIGTPTTGVLAFDMTYPSLFLPNTGLRFGFGRTMFVWPEGHFAEGIGIEPDIWAAGDALAVALALLAGE
ncbi:MAG: S41 family peptidase [Defluviitaleaceae bacterium]|nr:S41 family peptidase [Defluviitaleaceae bacterium]